MEEIKNKQVGEQVPVTANGEEANEPSTENDLTAFLTAKKEELEEMVRTLEKDNDNIKRELLEEKESRRRCYDYWQEAENKVRALKLIIAAAAKQPGFNAREVFEAIGE